MRSWSNDAFHVTEAGVGCVIEIDAGGELLRPCVRALHEPAGRVPDIDRMRHIPHLAVVELLAAGAGERDEDVRERKAQVFESAEWETERVVWKGERERRERIEVFFSLNGYI